MKLNECLISLGEPMALGLKKIEKFGKMKIFQKMYLPIFVYRSFFWDDLWGENPTFFSLYKNKIESEFS